MADENSLKAPTSSASIVSGWTDITNIYTSNDQRAQSETLNSVMAGYNFGFSIPTGSVINGIIVSVEGYGAGNNASRRSLTAALSKDAGANVAGDVGASTDMGSGEAVTTWGASDSLWNTTWSVDDINSSNFAVRIAVSGSGGYIRYVDYVTVDVYYTSPSATNMQIVISETWKDVTNYQIIVGGTWKVVTGLQSIISGAWKTIF